MTPALAASTFVTFGAAHWAVMGLTAAAAVALPAWARRARSPGAVRGVAWAIAIALVANELVDYVYGVAVEGWVEFARRYLPLHVCGAGLYLTAWVLVRPNRYVFEVAYFWGLGGTVQAVLTPDLQAGFPSYPFFQYFICHCLIVVGVVFAAVALRLRPGRGAVWRIIVITNAYMVLVAGANVLLGSNYMYLCRAPGGASPFFFLPWPWYIAVLELVGVAFVVLLYLPFAVGGARKSRFAPAGGSAIDDGPRRTGGQGPRSARGADADGTGDDHV